MAADGKATEVKLEGDIDAKITAKKEQIPDIKKQKEEVFASIRTCLNGHKLQIERISNATYAPKT